MFRLCFSLLVCFTPFYLGGVDVSVVAQEHAKMRLCIVTLNDDQLQQVAQIVQKDLSWSNQFDVDCVVQDRINSRTEVKRRAKEYPLIIFLTHSSDDAIEWRLYDSAQVQMISGKKVEKNGSVMRGWAHRCADGIWYALTGSPGIFSSKIVFCKEKRFPGKMRPYKHVYVADFDGSHVRALVTTPTVSLAPRWNRGASRIPLIYYSECTTRNVRLVATTMNGRRHVVSNFDGLNMMASWSPGGEHAVLCLSRNGGTHLYLYEHAQGETLGAGLEQLTFNGLNVSPCFIDDNRIVFCSDDNVAKKPYLCLMSLDEQVIRQLVTGYCSSPTYCPETGKIAFAKRVLGKLQLFTYNLKTEQEEQVTHGAGNKESCSWSPGGSALVFAVEDGIKSQIMILNLQTKQQRSITLAHERCSYPAWSPLYQNAPFIE